MPHIPHWRADDVFTSVAALGTRLCSFRRTDESLGVVPRAVGVRDRRVVGLLLRALKIGDASEVAPVDKLSVVIVALFAVVFLGERPASREWLGIGMVAAGVLVLSIKR